MKKQPKMKAKDKAKISTDETNETKSRIDHANELVKHFEEGYDRGRQAILANNPIIHTAEKAAILKRDYDQLQFEIKQAELELDIKRARLSVITKMISLNNTYINTCISEKDVWPTTNSENINEKIATNFTNCCHKI